MFGDFVFPDGSEMMWPSVNWLQKRFMKWFNKERTKKLLTFPVETVNLLDDGEKFVDEEWADFAAEMWSEGHSFFMYRSNSVDSLSSCCRLRNEVEENQFSYTLGAGGISTGSKCVMTLNINRIVQQLIQPMKDENNLQFVEAVIPLCASAVRDKVKDVHKYLTAFDTILRDREKAKLIPIYEAGYVSPDRQYLTIGINGLVEAAQYLGFQISSRDENYKAFVNSVLKAIHDQNVEDRNKNIGIRFNTEYVPKHTKSRGHIKSSLIDLELLIGQQGASVMVA